MKRFICLLAVVYVVMSCCSVYAAEQEETHAYVIGEVKNRLYTNRTLGAEAYFGENWRILSQKEIATINGFASSLSPSFEELTGGKMPVFYVAANDWSANINITISNIGVMGEAVLSDPKSEIFDEFMKNVTKGLYQSYTEMGIIDIQIKRIVSKFIGSNTQALRITSKLNNAVEMYQKQVICIRGEYAFFVTSTSIGYDITDQLLSMFRKLRDD